MQCSRCGAAVRPGMTECARCGAPLTSSAGNDMFGPSQRYTPGYVPGGGAPQQQSGASLPPEQSPQQRQLGSLQRRLQRSQASMPGEDDEEYMSDRDDSGRDEPPVNRSGERARRSRPLDRQNDPYGPQNPRRSSASGDGFGERARRSRPFEEPPVRRGPPSGNRARGGRGGRDGRDGYSDYDESREDPAYSPYPAYDPRGEGLREDVGWDESREEPAYEPPHRRSGPERYRELDESDEMSAEEPAYEPPRHQEPRRRSRPVDDRDRDEYTNPLEDPRSPLRGSQSRRLPSDASRRGSRAGGGYPPASGPRRPADPYVDPYADYSADAMGAPRYPDERSGYAARGSAGYGGEAPAGRGPRGWDDGYAPARGRERDEEDYASREGWAAPAVYPSYHPQPYNQPRREGAFDESAEIWQPGAAARGVVQPPARSRRGAEAQSNGRATKKRAGGALRMAFSLLATLAVIAALGVEYGPKMYHLVLARGAGATSTSAPIACASETTPGTQTKPPTGQSLFTTTAYTLTYPNGWQKTSQSGTSANQCDVVYLFAQPNGAARFNVEEAGAFGTLSDLQVIQAEAQNAQQQGTTFTEITSAATTQSIGGEVWQRREYQATSKTGVKMRLALLAGHHKGAGFAIILLSSDAGFASDDTTSFEPMLHSFQFV